MTKDQNARRVRTLFISDLHLGTKGCQADLLLEFLRHYDADIIYLVGDIIDGWRLKSGWYWPQAHNDVVQKLLLGGIEICDRAIHETADGRRLLVMHGDEFDMVMKHARWLASLGDSAYTLALFLNTHLNAVRRRLGFTYWSLSAWAKGRVKNAVSFISQFEEFLVAEALRNRADGIVCGHIHHAAQSEIKGVSYLNTGDWVESCTAIVEDYDGVLRLVRWTDERAELMPSGTLTEVLPPRIEGKRARKAAA